MSIFVKNGPGVPDEKEYVRLGDMNAWQNQVYTGYGIGLGDVAGNKYLVYTPSGGLKVRGRIEADEGYLGNLDITGLLKMGNDTNGIKIGNIGGSYYFRGIGGGTTQVEIRAGDGKLYAGNSAVWLDTNGYAIDIAVDKGNVKSKALTYYESGVQVGNLVFTKTTSRITSALSANAYNLARTAVESYMTINSTAKAATSRLTLQANIGGSGGESKITLERSTFGYSIAYEAQTHTFVGAVAGTSTIAAASGSGGFSSLVVGDATHAGYLAIHRSDGARNGYIGYDNDNLNITVERGALTINGTIATVNRSDPGFPVHTAQYIFANDHNLFYRNHNSGVYASVVPMGVFDINLSPLDAHPYNAGAAYVSNCISMALNDGGWSWLDWPVFIPQGWYNRTWNLVVWWSVGVNGNVRFGPETRILQGGSHVPSVAIAASDYRTLAGTANTVVRTVFNISNTGFPQNMMIIRLARAGGDLADSAASTLNVYGARLLCHPFQGTN